MGIPSRLQNLHSGNATHEQVHENYVVFPLLEHPKRFVTTGTSGDGVSLTSQNGDTTLSKGVITLDDEQPQICTRARSDRIRIGASLTIE
jgi:hypothetical protein